MTPSRSRTAGVLRSGSRLTAVMAILAVFVAGLFTHPAQAVPIRIPAPSPIVQAESKTALMLGLLDEVTPTQWIALRHWPTARLVRLHRWVELGIAFEGAWTPGELDLLVTVLDAFGATCGEVRFAELMRAAAVAESGGTQDQLRLVKAPGASMPAARWRRKAGEILFLAGLFDDSWFVENYAWRFLEGSYVQPRPDVTLRQLIIGHELGHVLVDGLRVEITAAGQDPFALETLYGEMIPPAQWPHLGYVMNENLVTELSLWVLGFERTPEVEALRAVVGEYVDSDPIALQ
ncbi:MAG: hypothetical protein JXC32_06350 [Anaerolineae bacterium]|nr:hypothetical protein [Anaerolineae bacterium]